jgi:hypothetical protein
LDGTRPDPRTPGGSEDHRSRQVDSSDVREGEEVRDAERVIAAEPNTIRWPHQESGVSLRLQQNVAIKDRRDFSLDHTQNYQYNTKKLMNNTAHIINKLLSYRRELVKNTLDRTNPIRYQLFARLTG